MTNQPVQLDQLDVIGYADVLPNGRGPAIVPPIFCDRSEPDLCYCPPFRIAGNWLLDPQCVAFAEIEDWVRAEHASLPDDFSRPALPDHQLWVDEDGQVMYEPIAEANRKLGAIYRTHLSAGEVALREGRLDDASRQAGIALAANVRALEPRALMATCHALNGKEKQALFLKQAAESMGHTPESFAACMERYAETVPSDTWEALPFDWVSAVFTACGANVQRKFDLPTGVAHYVTMVLHAATICATEQSTEIACAGRDADFLMEFSRLFKYNYLAKATAGVAVEVARKAYWLDKSRERRLTPEPEPSLDVYFARLRDVLVETGRFYDERKPTAGQTHV